MEDFISLSYIIMPTSITYIDDYAFINCESFSSIFYLGTQMKNDLLVKIPFNVNIYYYSENEPVVW